MGPEKRVSIVAESGDVDGAAESVLDELAARSGRVDVVLDLAACGTASVQALRTLSVATDRVRKAGGTLTVIGVGPVLLRLIDELGFAGSFTIANWMM